MQIEKNLAIIVVFVCEQFQLFNLELLFLIFAKFNQVAYVPRNIPKFECFSIQGS